MKTIRVTRCVDTDHVWEKVPPRPNVIGIIYPSLPLEARCTVCGYERWAEKEKTTTYKLNDCPDCGSPAVIMRRKNQFLVTRYRAVCNGCNLYSKTSRSREEVAIAWNRGELQEGKKHDRIK